MERRVLNKARTALSQALPFDIFLRTRVRLTFNSFLYTIIFIVHNNDVHLQHRNTGNQLIKLMKHQSV